MHVCVLECVHVCYRMHVLSVLLCECAEYEFWHWHGGNVILL